jgi:hypothetical protein
VQVSAAIFPDGDDNEQVFYDYFIPSSVTATATYADQETIPTPSNTTFLLNGNASIAVGVVPLYTRGETESSDGCSMTILIRFTCIKDAITTNQIQVSSVASLGGVSALLNLFNNVVGITSTKQSLSTTLSPVQPTLNITGSGGSSTGFVPYYETTYPGGPPVLYYYAIGSDGVKSPEVVDSNFLQKFKEKYFP